jgi:hypothetical protein
MNHYCAPYIIVWPRIFEGVSHHRLQRVGTTEASQEQLT